MPLDLLWGFGLPKRGPGYLDLARIDDRLTQAAAAAGRQIELREDGILLCRRRARLRRPSLLSDRSFGSYASAAAACGPRLPESTDLFGTRASSTRSSNIRCAPLTPHLSVRYGRGARARQTAQAAARINCLSTALPAPHVFPGGSGWIALRSALVRGRLAVRKAGLHCRSFVSSVSCSCCGLIAPIRQFRSVLALVLAFIALQAFTLTAAAS